MPLLGVGIQVSVQFGVTETLKKFMRNHFADEDGKLSIPYIMLAGLLSGIPSGTIAVSNYFYSQTPIDHARFRVLMNKDSKGPGSVKMAIQIAQKYGIRKLFLGYNSTVLRQMIGLSVYFGSYDFILENMMRIFSLDILTASFHAGGVAGMLTWAVVYPIHYLKVKIQNDDLVNPKYKSATSIAKDILSNQLNKMYTGVGWFLLRAYIVNGATFIAFEKTKKLLYSDSVN